MVQKNLLVNCETMDSLAQNVFSLNHPFWKVLLLANGLLIIS